MTNVVRVSSRGRMQGRQEGITPALFLLPPPSVYMLKAALLSRDCTDPSVEGTHVGQPCASLHRDPPVLQGSPPRAWRAGTRCLEERPASSRERLRGPHCDRGASLPCPRRLAVTFKIASTLFILEILLSVGLKKFFFFFDADHF